MDWVPTETWHSFSSLWSETYHAENVTAKRINVSGEWHLVISIEQIFNDQHQQCQGWEVKKTHLNIILLYECYTEWFDKIMDAFKHNSQAAEEGTDADFLMITQLKN